MRYTIDIKIDFNDNSKIFYTEDFNTRGDGKKVLKSNLKRIYEKAYNEYTFDDQENRKINNITLYGLRRIESLDIKRLLTVEEFEKISKKLNININDIDYENLRAHKKTTRKSES